MPYPKPIGDCAMANDTTELPAPVTIATIVATSAKTDKQFVEFLGRLPEFGAHPAQLRDDREPLPGSPRSSRCAEPRSRTCATR